MAKKKVSEEEVNAAHEEALVEDAERAAAVMPVLATGEPSADGVTPVTGPNGAKAEAAPVEVPVERRDTHAIPPISPQEREEAVDIVKALLTSASNKLKTMPGERAARALNKLTETIGALR